MIRRPLILLIILLLIQSSFSQSNDSEAQKIYLEAKKKTIDQQWDSAIQLFNKVIHNYPDCKYLDESQFWVGYCYEKKAGYLKQAFDAYAPVANSFQNAWSDDALLRQVLIAETLMPEDEKYKTFLLNQLGSSNIQIQQLAAIALAKAGDVRALPILKDIPKEEDLYTDAQHFIQELEKKQKSGSVENDEKTMSGNLSLTQPVPKNNLEFGSDGKRINYFAEKSLEQYQALVRKDDNWSNEELLNFGLWHILRTDLFDIYILKDEEGKQRFLRQLWVINDPTPTTDINEEKIEFERRVFYAREHYSYFDNFEGYYYAPWDARGEIYIKYGSPNSRHLKNFDEIWYYTQYDRLQFYIRPNVTNIFGRAIFLQPYMSPRLRKITNNKKAVYDFVYTPKFVYHYDYNKKFIKNFKTHIQQSQDKVILRYEMPAKEFKILKEDSFYYTDYMLKYVVYNEEFYKIIFEEQRKRISDPSKNYLKKMLISESIELDLKPGDYFFGLSIESEKSKKIAIEKKSMTVKNFLEQ